MSRFDNRIQRRNAHSFNGISTTKIDTRSLTEVYDDQRSASYFAKKTKNNNLAKKQALRISKNGRRMTSRKAVEAKNQLVNLVNRVSR